MEIIPITLRTANEFVRDYHRHHPPVAGCKFAIGCQSDSQLVGVAICGRPVSRMLDNGRILEINRLCTNGTRNACSMLYGACVRVARAMGYQKIITYILASEPGTSLRASGFICEGTAGGLEWKGEREKHNPRQYPREMKQRWAKTLYPMEKNK